MSTIITREQLTSLIQRLLQEKTIVAAPVAAEQGRFFFEKIQNADRAVLNGHVKTINSIKELIFPRHEVLYTFVRKGNDVEIADAAPFVTPQVIMGCRPCDAAALPILDPLFAWDYQDRFFQSRREMTTVVSMACQTSDDHCFCTSVGGGPDHPRGSDAMLFDLGNETFEVRLLTEKGQKLFADVLSPSDQTGRACVVAAKSIEMKKIQAWINEHFDSPLWEKMAQRCIGCGACTYLCPTCHCFDIVDEGSFKKGERVKNWDSCQSTLFTLHASGHNPRSNQGQRQRQRISHKFAIYPEKFGEYLCTGCGNCTRGCSGSLGVRPFLDAILQAMTQEESKES